jgi:predicted MFS family arabinose efflux permease
MIYLSLTCAGLYTPFVYVTEKAKRQLGIAPARANLILSVLGAFNTVSRVVTGLIADKNVDCLKLHNFAAIIAGGLTCLVSVFNNYALLMVYGALFGIAIGRSLTCICSAFRNRLFFGCAAEVVSIFDKFASGSAFSNNLFG